jgi:hypothetical protein
MENQNLQANRHTCKSDSLAKTLRIIMLENSSDDNPEPFVFAQLSRDRIACLSILTGIVGATSLCDFTYGEGECATLIGFR